MRLMAGTEGESTRVKARLQPVSLATAALIILLGASAPQALAQAERYVGTNFTPQVSVSASTTQAGAHPDIDIRMRKTPSHCTGVPPGPDYLAVCPAEEAYLEQDLKAWTVELPPGLLADINATPQCVDPQFDRITQYDESCPEETQIGSVRSEEPYLCAWREQFQLYVCYEDPRYRIVGKVFNGSPQPGEQGHLYALVGVPTIEGTSHLLQRVDVSVRLRTGSDWGIEAVATDIPDAICSAPFGALEGCVAAGGTQMAYYPAPEHDLTMTLEGSKGVERGRPLTLNPTSCQPRELGSVFRGYAQNVWIDPDSSTWKPGSGDGLTAESSTPYPVTGCNGVPYDPKLSLAVDPPSPKEPAAITSTLTQQVGEQTTKEVRVEIPKSFKVNLDNSLEQCSADQAQARSCPGSSQVGEVVAESNLLPETGQLAGPLRGEVFVGETTSENIKMYVVLHGFVEATLEGRLEINADGSTRAVFEMPEVPQQEITLKLFGGKDKALVLTPKTCGAHVLNASFTSHQGKQVRQAVPIAIACDEAALDVDIGTRRAKAHPTISLTASAAGMKALSFRIPSGLKVKARPAVGKGYGTLDFVTQDGTTSTKLDLLRTSRKRRSVLFSAVEGKAQVTSLVLRHKKANTIAVSGLPEGTLSATLELVGKKDNLLSNPSTCRQLERTGKGKRKATGERRDLNYSATVTNVEGKTMTPTLRSSMACGRAKVKKRR